MNRIIKFPTAMVTGDHTASSLVLDGGSVIDQCIATAGDKGTFFLEQHLLYVVLGGEVKLTCGKQTCVVRKNEMVLLRRSTRLSADGRKFSERTKPKSVLKRTFPDSGFTS